MQGDLSGVAFITNLIFPDISSASVSSIYCSYLVMPYMFTDLSKVRGNLSEDKVQFLVYQMLCGLRVRPHLWYIQHLGLFLQCKQVFLLRAMYCNEKVFAQTAKHGESEKVKLGV